MMHELHLFMRKFSHALRGLFVAFKLDQSFRFEVAIFLVISILLWVVPLTQVERYLVLLVAAFVIVVELANTAIEKLADFVQPEWHAAVRDIKDIGAAAVLVASLLAFIVGITVFAPHLFFLIRHV